METKPKKELTHDQIEEFNSVLRAKEEADNMSDQEIIDTIIAMQEGSGSTFH